MFLKYFLPAGIFFLLVFILALFSEGTYDTGDSISHFQIARFSFQHPYLFLDLWGKPVFTLFASPFAQFGFKGIVFFNILCASITACLAVSYATKANIEYPRLGFIFIPFVPIYFVCLISGLTEIFFGLVLVLGIYLIAEKKYLISALIISALPFIRSEGFLLLPLFALVLAMRKQFKSIPFLLTGTFVIALAGFIHSGNMYWLMESHPYIGGNNVYGHGSWNHFLRKNEYILGVPVLIFFLIGSYSYVSQIRTSIKNNNPEPLLIEEIILVCGSFFVYFIAHSLFWWKGWFASAGLIRVMAGVAPLAGIISLRGMDFILKLLGEKKLWKNIFIGVVSLFVIWMPFKQHKFPRPLDYEQKQIKATSEWIRENNLVDKKMYYLYPYFSFAMNIDPFENPNAVQLWSVHADNLDADISSGSLVIWDSHFSPNEGKIPFSLLNENKKFRLLQKFSSGKDELFFEVYVFEKLTKYN